MPCTSRSLVQVIPWAGSAGFADLPGTWTPHNVGRHDEPGDPWMEEDGETCVMVRGKKLLDHWRLAFCCLSPQLVARNEEKRSWQIQCMEWRVTRCNAMCSTWMKKQSKTKQHLCVDVWLGYEEFDFDARRNKRKERLVTCCKREYRQQELQQPQQHGTGLPDNPPLVLQGWQWSIWFTVALDL
jgi:hypothetical protein